MDWGGRGLTGGRDPHRREVLGWAESVKDPKVWLSPSCLLSLGSPDKWRQSQTRCLVSPPLVAASQRGEPGAGEKVGDASWLKNAASFQGQSPAGSALDLDLLSEEVISLTTCSQGGNTKILVLECTEASLLHVRAYSSPYRVIVHDRVIAFSKGSAEKLGKPPNGMGNFRPSG